MAAFGYVEPAIYMPGGNVEPDVQPYPCASGLGIKRGDFVTFVSGSLARPTGAVGTGIATSNILGMTEMDQTAIYTNATVPATPQAANTTLFGTTLQGTAMQTGLEFAGVKTVLAHNGQQFEVTLNTAVVWAYSLIGTSCGVALDSTTNVYFADTTATNVVAKIVGEIDGPNKGAVGDTGKRVIIQFLATVLAL